MDAATLMMIQRAQRQLESDCSSARATSMREVQHAGNVHAAGYIRSLPEARRAIQRLHDDATRKMDKLLDEQLQKLAACNTRAEMLAERGRLLTKEWGFLRGTYATVYRRAERDSARILHARQVHDNEDDQSLAPSDSPSLRP
jgi:predicted metal-dependent hydrolase